MNLEYLEKLEQLCGAVITEPWEIANFISVSRARIPQLVRAIRELKQGLECTSRWLNEIKYECNASVYTLSDDEFQTVFEVRDNANRILGEVFK